MVADVLPGSLFWRLGVVVVGLLCCMCQLVTLVADACKASGGRGGQLLMVRTLIAQCVCAAHTMGPGCVFTQGLQWCVITWTHTGHHHVCCVTQVKVSVFLVTLPTCCTRLCVWDTHTCLCSLGHAHLLVWCGDAHWLPCLVACQQVR
jgi:hypothetical protein